MNELYFLILAAAVIIVFISAHMIPKGAEKIADIVLDPLISKAVAWGKKTWYTRLLYVCLLPFTAAFIFTFMVVLLAPISVILELLWQFPGKTIYWIVNGKDPEHSSLFHRWEEQE